jgi:hypothetical protein
MNIPLNGFYYHFKHDEHGPVNMYAYEVLGVARHTERTDEFVVIYKPLYKNNFLGDAKFFVRPLELFLKPATNTQGEQVERFTRITDHGIIQQILAAAPQTI